ncbi:DNA polymerase III subunit delta [Clostridium sp. Cult2]|uniref:DNA polymerase III subunit delta n=1 Tax=Clostridium sp. Cult2 TaxID=2079003 RepID=UPI001F031A75|nr:DNA polymerase III subunit delta [Clostridium sp. Cult2]
MNYKEFINKAKSKNLKPVYLFYGEEEYLIDYTLNVVKDIFIDKSFEPLNYIVLDGKEIDFDIIFNACETLPFMSEKKIVIINDLPLFNSKREEGTTSEEWNLPPSKNPLTKYVEELEDYLCLLFVEKDKNIKKSNALYKAINRAGGIVEFTKLRGIDLDNWVQNSFKNYNKKISKPNINYFLQQSSYFDSNRNRTLYDLENEIIKISNYLSNGEEVNREIINLLMAKPLEMNVFNLLNSISQKNGENAIRLFNEMYISNEPVLFILHMIVRQLRNMLNYKVLRLKGYSEGDIYSKMNLSRYEYQKVSNQSNNFTVPQLERAMLHCLETDKIIKTTSVDDRLALEILLTNLCFKI